MNNSIYTNSITIHETDQFLQRHNLPNSHNLKQDFQISYNYTVEVTNQIRSDRVPEELRVKVHNIVQEAVIKTIPKKKKRRKAKWLSEEALQIAEKRSEVK